MACGLSKSEQRLEDLQLRASESVCRRTVEQRAPIVRAQLVVQRALRLLELAVQRLLRLGRQIRLDSFLCSAEDKWRNLLVKILQLLLRLLPPGLIQHLINRVLVVGGGEQLELFVDQDLAGVQKVERFQTDPSCRLFLISLKAGGLGLNLTAAEYVFLLDPWWNPAVEAQAIDRAHRIGQARHVFAYRLIARDTVEERVVDLQQSKRRLADAILTADTSLIRDLRREDFERLLS